MRRWSGKVALVTGASAGISAALARRLAAEGMKVVVAARRQERLAALVDAIGAAGGEALPVVTDLRDEASILALLKHGDALRHSDTGEARGRS